MNIAAFLAGSDVLQFGNPDKFPHSIVPLSDSKPSNLTPFASKSRVRLRLNFLHFFKLLNLNLFEMWTSFDSGLRVLDSCCSSSLGNWHAMRCFIIRAALELGSSLPFSSSSSFSTDSFHEYVPTSFFIH